MIGLQRKVIPLFEQRAAAIILILDKQSAAMIPFDFIPSNLSREMYRYLGPDTSENGIRIPMIYLVKDTVLRSLFEGQKYDPVHIEEDGIKKYQTSLLLLGRIWTMFPIRLAK